MLTEQEVSRSWRSLLTSRELTSDVVAKAEYLLGELRPESPLRHRLGTELDAIRKQIEAKVAG